MQPDAAARTICPPSVYQQFLPVVRQLGTAAALIILLCTIASSNWAYDMAGHYYTHAAILRETQNESFDPYRLIESFCAELPDLAYELDATVQRVRVLKDVNEWEWGVVGNCTTKTCTHMVAIQFYLHGLTGTSPESIRNAATTMLNELQETIDALKKQTGTNVQQNLVNVACTRGFATHLFGDTHAHVMLKDEGLLYKPGLGHAKDKHEPDYVFRRGAAHWMAWVKDLAAHLGTNNHGPIQTQAIKPDKPDQKNKSGEEHRQDECEMQEKLTSLATTRWARWSPPIEDWASSVCPSRKSTQGKLAQLSDLWSPTLKRCQEVLEEGPTTDGKPTKTLGTILKTLSVPLPIPQCDKVWKDYLGLAYERFNAQKGVQEKQWKWNGWWPEREVTEKKLNPEALSHKFSCGEKTNCKVEQDTLADGWK